MRFLAVALLCLFLFGCSAPEPATPPVDPQPPVVTPPAEPQPPEVVPEEPPVDERPDFSRSYKKGYNDGYGGNWIQPIGWVVANDYRAGWNDGRDDKEAGKPNKFSN